MASSNRQLKLLPRELLLKTGPVDHADWNHRPVLGWIQRLRFRMVLSLLPGARMNRLLEVGYGSGVFMPTLATRCDELYGIDRHPMNHEVAHALGQEGIAAHLTSGSAEEMPFADGHFDAVVAVSCVEFIDNLEAACLEIRRVLKPDGAFVMVTPGHSPVVDLGLKLLTGESARRDYGDRREALIPTLLRHFAVRAQRTAPPVGTSILCLYTAFDFIPLR